MCAPVDAETSTFVRKLFGTELDAIRILGTDNCQIDIEVGEHETSFAKYVEAPKSDAIVHHD